MIKKLLRPKLRNWNSMRAYAPPSSPKDARPRLKSRNSSKAKYLKIDYKKRRSNSALFAYLILISPSLRRSAPPPCRFIAAVNSLYSITIAFDDASSAMRIASNTLSCVMECSVPFMQSSMNSPKKGYPTFPNTS
jgi:hypothetical protein